MAHLNLAKGVYVRGVLAKAVYIGSVLVWSQVGADGGYTEGYEGGYSYEGAPEPKFYGYRGGYKMGYPGAE